MVNNRGWQPVRGPAEGVTIAIPNWNHELLLPRSISSALHGVKQLRSAGVPAEVLVVDDCSRDGSLSLLRQLEALHYHDGLRVMGLARNLGMPAAVRNVALHAARFQYVAFLDADNEIVPENLHAFYRSIVATSAAIVYGNLLAYDSATTPVGFVSNESFQRRMFQANYIDTCALADRFQVTDDGGWTADPRVRCEDWELYLHLGCTGRRIVFVPLVFGYYYDLPHSVVKTAQIDGPAENNRVRRTFDQLGIRDRISLNTELLRYHPDIGWI
jgi:glycosyltransferase involved in cell wall biosynthesis